MAARVISTLNAIQELTGREAGVSEWIDVSQFRIDQFADATEDHQWIHVDAERAAAESPYKTTIAHGFLTLSLLPVMMSQALDIREKFRMKINYGLNRIRFPAPVRSGSRVRGRFRVDKVEAVEGGVQVTWGVTVEAEGSPKPCIAAEWLTRYYR